MVFWHNCLSDLAKELSVQQMDLWVRPLEFVENKDGSLKLLAPNWPALLWVKEKYKSRIEQLASNFYGRQVLVTLGLKNNEGRVPLPHDAAQTPHGVHKTTAVASEPFAPSPQISQKFTENLLASRSPRFVIQPSSETSPTIQQAAIAADQNNHEKSRLNKRFTFDNLVTGRANDLAQAAAMQVATQPGSIYNPLYIYGGVGLGKTHLLHAVGNHIFRNQPNLVVRYVHSEDYVADVVRTCRMKSFDDFKNFYRSIDVLLIDDIQFFKGKDRTQEEFFFSFNALLDSKRQVIITCDTYPKDIQGLEHRLVSRLDWGLTVQIEPPELEMRIAILHEKAATEHITLPDDVAFLIAKNLRSNVRELEGALKKVMAYANFHGAPISIEVCRNALRDIFHANRRQVTVEIIKKTVSDYFKLSINDMHSTNRSRNIARPRQIAMWLAKELTVMSLPSIGEAFGGRDHTTVLHAHRLISKLRQNDPSLNQDLHLLTQTLQG